MRHGLGGRCLGPLNGRSVFPQGSGGQASETGAGRAGVSGPGRPAARALYANVLCEATGHARFRPPHRASVYLNYFFKGPISKYKYRDPGVRTSTREFGGHHPAYISPEPRWEQQVEARLQSSDFTPSAAGSPTDRRQGDAGTAWGGQDALGPAGRTRLGREQRGWDPVCGLGGRAPGRPISPARWAPAPERSRLREPCGPDPLRLGGCWSDSAAPCPRPLPASSRHGPGGGGPGEAAGVGGGGGQRGPHLLTQSTVRVSKTPCEKRNAHVP